MKIQQQYSLDTIIANNIQSSIQSNCLNCSNKLENIDEFLKRLDGFTCNFLVDLICITCYQIRQQTLTNNVTGEIHSQIDLVISNKNNASYPIENSTDFLDTNKIKLQQLTTNETNHVTTEFLDTTTIVEEVYDEEYLLQDQSDDIETMSLPQIPGDFCCTTCNKKYDSLAKLQAHGLHKHNSERIYKPTFTRNHYKYVCDLCNTNYSTLKRLRGHIYYKHTVNSQSCKKFISEENVTTVELTKNLYKCDICHEDFSRLRILRDHMKLKHSNVNNNDQPLKFVCNTCNTVYGTYKNLQAHIYYKHSSVNVRKTFTNQLSSDCTRKYIHQCNDAEMLVEKKNNHSDLADYSSNENLINLSEQFKYKCPLCIRSFATKVLMETHLKYVKHTKLLTYLCKFCHTNHDTEEALRSHYYCKHSKNSEDLEVTKDNNDLIEILQDHTEIATADNEFDQVTEQNKFYCSYCYRPYKTKELQLAHEQYNHHSQQEKTVSTEFMCKICRKYYNSKKLLQSHMSYKHGKSKYSTFKCRICDVVYGKRSERQKHEHDVHFDSAAKQYPCPHCDQQFIAARYLETHIFEHADYKPFVCEQCGKAYYREDLLKIHSRTHQGNVYKCDVCDKQFKQLFTLNRHKLMHDGMKLVYSCQQCDMHYADSRDLRRHTFTHGNHAKEYQCTICGQKFYLQCDLNRHIRLQHNRLKIK